MPALITANQIGLLLAATPLTESLRQPWAVQLGWTLLHSLWQLAAVAVAYGIIDKLLRRHSSQTRYVTAVATLAVMALLPVATWSRLREAPRSQTVPLSSAPVVTNAGRSPTENPGSLPSVVAATTPDLALSQDVNSTTAPLTRSEAASITESPLTASNVNAVELLRQWCEPWLGMLVSVWLAGVVLASLRPLMGLWTQVRLRRVGLSLVPESVQEMLDRLARRMGVRRVLKLAGSTLVQAPAVVGYLRPLILLPASALTGLSPRELEAVLAHELAHVHRHDWLINAFQLVIETLLFFHPAVWWVSRRIRQEREHCCDDMALAVMGDRVAYGRLLLTMEHLRHHLPAPSLGADGGSLVQRIRRIAGREKHVPRGWEDWIVTMLMLAIGIIGILGASNGVAEQVPQKLETEQPPSERRNEPESVPSDKSADKAKPGRPQTNPPTPTTPQPDVKRPEPAPEVSVDLPLDWFRFDPYPGLGHSDDLGEGWRYLRLASDHGARLELGLSREQHRALVTLNDVTTKRQAAVRGADFLQQRVAVWNEAQASARELVDEAQDRRIRQIAFQRQSYNALLNPAAQEALSFTPAQSQRLDESIKTHISCVHDYDAELAKITRQLEEEERVGERSTRKLIDQAKTERNRKGVASHQQVWADVFLMLTVAQREKLAELRGPPVVEPAPPSKLAWERTDKYVPPDFANFFPDDPAAGKRLDDLYESRTQQALSDQDILETVRRGLKRTTQHQTLVLAWIGNQYIWGQARQNPQAIEIMYHASGSPDRGNTGHYAVYFGLSVVQNKTPNLLRALTEAAVDSIPDTRSRIVWGVGAAHKDAFAVVLSERLDSSELSDRQRITMYDMYRQVAGKAPPRAERFASLGLFQFDYAPKPGVTLETAEAMTARFMREIDPLEEGTKHATRFVRGMLVGESQVRSITQRDTWIERFKASESLQLVAVQVVDVPVRALGPLPLSVPVPPEGDLCCQIVLRWLPPDTETLVVARGPALKVPETNQPERNLQDIAGWLLLLHASARESHDERIELLRKYPPKFIVKAGRRFRAVKLSGAIDYDGAVITGFQQPLPTNGQTFLDTLYLKQGAKVATVNGFPAAWVPMPGLGGGPSRGHWYVMPRPDLMIDGPDDEYIKTILTRMQNSPTDRTFQADHPLWKHVDLDADVFALRKLDIPTHAEKRIEQRQLLGMTLSAKLGLGVIFGASWSRHRVCRLRRSWENTSTTQQPPNRAERAWRHSSWAGRKTTASSSCSNHCHQKATRTPQP